MTPVRLMVLSALQQVGEGMTQREFADQIGNKEPTLVRMLDNLQRMGLIERRFDPHDRRSHRLHLTPLGRDVANGINEKLSVLNLTLFEGVNDSDIRLTVRVVERIVENLEKDSFSGTILESGS